MAKTTYVVEGKQGKGFERTTETKAYTHAVVATNEKGTAAWSFHSSAELAEKRAQEIRGYKDVSGVEVLPVVEKEKSVRGVSEAKKEGKTEKEATKTEEDENMVTVAVEVEVKLVELVAFTGMPLGSFPVTKETKTQVTIKTKTGAELKFDKKTGTQIGAKNPKFANRIKL